MELIPGIIAYFIGAYMCCVSRVFVWRIASHWSKIWVADASQADSQILSLSVVITGLIVFGISVFIWSIANHINYKFTEKGFVATGAAGLAIALAVSQNDWLDEIAAKMTYAS
ncbi:hypothetical protein [Chamaesiphon minutus]|uniref:Uncharacterized protein n=1 Tax=Chamaesiphon minutus (strain ATCC 27169 / PCC 6605) TaxID=1173020 RepID=K9UIB7_CHAP6|nr:hypothetical protein [Chamaesiphon minutus]AFY94196.1 hypothetical protein Cha6605_3184 [Chamaesiphon minutus PCC 6605]